MEIKYYRSATVGLKFDNFKILMDPWLTDGEYYGAWSLFPYFDIKKNLSELNSYDAIYISHIHPDHCSEETLKNISKDIPVYIHTYHKKFLKLKIERLGFKVIEVQNNKKINIGANVELNIIAADNCNPELCYKHVGCAVLNGDKENSQQIDSVAIINDKKYCVVNTNDTPYDLACETLDAIKKQYQNIDLLMTGYSGAGPYPQCFPQLNDQQKIIEGNKKKQFFLDQAFNFIKKIKPNYYFLFAGTYNLSGKLWNLEKFKGVPSFEEANNYLQKKTMEENIKNSIPLKLNTDCEFNLLGKKSNYPYKKINKLEVYEYAKNILSKKKLTYERNEKIDIDEIYELSKKAHQKYLDFKFLTNSSFKTNTYIVIKNHLLKIPHNNESISLEKTIDSDYDYLKLNLDERLLKDILSGPRYAHWNNADIGSHIQFSRNNDIYQRDVHYCLNFFHS